MDEKKPDPSPESPTTFRDDPPRKPKETEVPWAKRSSDKPGPEAEEKRVCV